MTASAPVGQMSKSTTEVPAGRLNSELDAGEGVTLSSAVANREGAGAQKAPAQTQTKQGREGSGTSPTRASARVH